VKISVIILCAGVSRRMGLDKSLLDFGNLKSIEIILKKIKEVGFSQTIIVAGKNIKNIQKYTKNENFAINKNHELRSLSIKKGLNLIHPENGCLIWPVDYPLVEKKTLIQLKENYESNMVVSPSFNKKGGHPILIGSKLLKSLAKINSKEPLKRWVKKQKRKILKTSDEWINYEMNTKKEYTKAKKLI
tara:strand:+ start:644 stop:1207 length:564 start_codon:yes stop_codon:yes gene_type:complete